jgi:hypothetical protein
VCSTSSAGERWAPRAANWTSATALDSYFVASGVLSVGAASSKPGASRACRTALCSGGIAAQPRGDFRRRGGSGPHDGQRHRRCLWELSEQGKRRACSLVQRQRGQSARDWPAGPVQGVRRPAREARYEEQDHGSACRAFSRSCAEHPPEPRRAGRCYPQACSSGSSSSSSATGRTHVARVSSACVDISDLGIGAGRWIVKWSSGPARVSPAR